MRSNLTSYNESLTYLYGLQKHGIKLGLANTEELMRILGQPHASFRSIHIAGTNGKGSTATALASILKEQGFKTGLFTSPHLVSFTERIRIDGERITESDVLHITAEIYETIKDRALNPTFFEFVTAMAFHYFAGSGVDWAVIETGMGGRLDATNVITPEVSVITNISLDHREFLGNTLSEIAHEKAGIIKSGVPVITASSVPEVIMKITETGERRGSEVNIYGREFSGNITSMDDTHMRFEYTGDKCYGNLSVPVTGAYQLCNMCLAIRSAELLRRKGCVISDHAITSGLGRMRLEGRLEWISKDPPVVLDCAHNPEAAHALADSIRKLFPEKKIILVTGIMDDKDIRDILHPLVQLAESLILTKAKYERAASPEKLREKVLSIPELHLRSRPDAIISTSSVEEALHVAKTRCRPNNIILVTGSFYTVGEVKELSGCTGPLSRLRE